MFLKNFRFPVLLISAIALTTGCHDTPLAPEAAGSVGAPQAVRNTSPGDIQPFGCSVTSAAPGNSGAFRHFRIQLGFPASALSPTGSDYRFTYRSYADGAKLNRLLVCRVPATTAAVRLAYVRLGISNQVPLIVDRRAPEAQTGILGDEDNAILDPLGVTACQYGGEYPECKPKPVDPMTYLNDCSIYGVCGGGGGGTWEWGAGGGGGGTDGGTFTDGGPFVGAVTCILAFATTGFSMLDVADKFATVILTGRKKNEADRTYGMYVQQPTIDPMMQIHLESELNSATQAYRDAIGDLASAMNTSYLTAGGSAVACGVAFALPTP